MVWEHSRRSISINAYDAEANYIYGLCNKMLGNELAAEDGFSVALLTPSYRPAALIELAKLKLSQQDINRAAYYTEKLVADRPNDLEANKLLAVTYRKKDKRTEALQVTQKLEAFLHWTISRDLSVTKFQKRSRRRSSFQA